MAERRKRPSGKASGRKPRAPKPYQPTVDEQLQTGMPSADNVRQVIDAQSPAGAKFQILRTDERDSYDTPPKRKKTR